GVGIPIFPSPFANPQLLGPFGRNEPNNCRFAEEGFAEEGFAEEGVRGEGEGRGVRGCGDEG
ncbi:MAG: hypothetical protein JWQ59_522, partial [Cryobacterium sp.]|nr:hypothetical protein [Cryobacterium sp.]